MDTATPSTARRAGGYIAEAIAAVSLCYFAFGGSRWSQAAWAAFTVFAVAVVVVRVLYDTESQTSIENSRWKLRFGFALAGGLFAAAKTGSEIGMV